MGPKFWERLVGKRPEGQDEKLEAAPQAAAQPQDYRSLERGSKEWCQALTIKIIDHYIDAKKPWRKLNEMVDPDYMINTSRGELRRMAWRLFSLDVQSQFESEIPSEEEMAKETGIAEEDLRELFEQARKNWKEGNIVES